MGNGTYIKVYRKLLEWEWYSDTACVRVFLHLLLKANWEESTYRGVKVPRGSLVIGRKALATELGLTEAKIRVAIKRLQNAHSISQQITKQFTVVSVCEFDTYNPSKDADDQHLANRKPTDSQQIATSKEDNKIRRKEDIGFSLSSEPEKAKSSNSAKKEKLQHAVQRLKGLMNMRPATKIDSSGAAAIKRASETLVEITESEWAALESYYSQPSGSENVYKRTALATIVNNINGEINKASEWYSKRTGKTERTAKREIQEPKRWKEAMSHKLRDAPAPLAKWERSKDEAQWNNLRDSEKAELIEIIRTQLPF